MSNISKYCNKLSQFLVNDFETEHLSVIDFFPMKVVPFLNIFILRSSVLDL